KQKKDGIFISQDKYLAEILRKFGLTDGKSTSTPIDTEKPLLKDLDVAYSDSDYDGASLDRKSTTGGCQFLGCRLIFWQCKKQTVVATSSTKAEYVVAASCCAQVLWIQNQLLDYRDPEEESSAKSPTETKSKDKGKGIIVEEPKPIKKKQQVELDEAYAKKLHEELNQDIDWEVAMDHVKQKAKENPYVQRYQTMKKRPKIEAQARRNMMMYLKNTDGFIMDYFKGMYYDDIRLIFEAKFNSNIEFLLKTKEHIKEEENRAIASINETLSQKAAKRRRLNEEAEDVEELKQHLEIVPNEDDDVYIEATPLARKVLVVDYQIIHFNNKTH
nr:copia protein [Tanacetum cinerariifolium]